MNNYRNFALLYDELMNEAPYEQWIHYLEEMLNKHGNGGRRLLDIGCGTGSIAIPMARKGYAVSGIDLSEEMLAIAHSRAQEEAVELTLFQQDMRELQGFREFDCVFIFCDSLNYMETEDDVKTTFAHIYESLSPNGLFLFDVHSVYKIDELFIGQTFANNEEEISYIWNCFPGSTPHSVVHELTFFVKQNEVYERFEEDHYERTYPIGQYKEWLEEAGFELIQVTADFRSEPPSDTAERIFFAARKK